MDQSVTDRRSVRATGSKAVGWSRNRDAACHASKRRGRSRRRDRGSHSCGTRPWPGRAVGCAAARTFSGHGYSSCSRGCHGGSSRRRSLVASYLVPVACTHRASRFPAVCSSASRSPKGYTSRARRSCHYVGAKCESLFEEARRSKAPEVSTLCTSNASTPGFLGRPSAEGYQDALWVSTRARGTRCGLHDSR